MNIDEISAKQLQLMCLLDHTKWLDDYLSTLTNKEIQRNLLLLIFISNVFKYLQDIRTYICCIKDQVHVQNKTDAKVYFENPFS